MAAFLLKAARFNKASDSTSAFVTTNSVTQGEQVAMLWPLVFGQRNVIHFAHTSFLWSNLASKNAGVSCVILGLALETKTSRRLFDGDEMRAVANISPYLTATDSVIVTKRTAPLAAIGLMQSGNKPTDGGHLILDLGSRAALAEQDARTARFVKRYVGSQEIINGGSRWCLWIEHQDAAEAMAIEPIRARVDRVAELRASSRGRQANDNASTPYRFVFAPHTQEMAVVVPNVSSVNRQYLPVDITNTNTVVSNLASVVYDAHLWQASVVASRLHLAWIATVCGKLKTDYRYSNTLGWNTFPVPPLTDQNKADLTRCAEDILLAREAHWPATIADLYDPDAMPADLRAAHDKNDDTLERIYIGRRFKNDTERLEKLFEMYTQMTAKEAGAKAATPASPAKQARGRRKKAADE